MTFSNLLKENACHPRTKAGQSNLRLTRYEIIFLRHQLLLKRGYFFFYYLSTFLVLKVKIPSVFIKFFFIFRKNLKIVIRALSEKTFFRQNYRILLLSSF